MLVTDGLWSSRWRRLHMEMLSIWPDEGKPSEHVCETCGKPLHSGKKYCSPQCCGVARRVSDEARLRTCLQCGAQFCVNLTDTPWGLKPHGFSGYARPNGPRSRLKAVPPPTRTLHASPGERGSITSGSSAWHLVQDAFVLLPVGTTHHGTPKYDSVGKVQDVLPSILAQGEGPGNATRLRAKATQTRLSAWVRNPAACDGLFFCHNEGLMRSASPHVPYPDCTLFY